MKINWNIIEQEMKLKLVSSDKRWHISQMQEDNEESKFYLSNYDLLLTPYGIGSNFKTCFESFIDDCDARVEKIRKIQREAIEYLKQLNKE